MTDEAIDAMLVREYWNNDAVLRVRHLQLAVTMRQHDKTKDGNERQT